MLEFDFNKVTDEERAAVRKGGRKVKSEVILEVIDFCVDACAEINRLTVELDKLRAKENIEHGVDELLAKIKGDEDIPKGG